MENNTQKQPKYKVVATASPKQKKKPDVMISISRVFRNLSISVNITIYTIYLIYLIYSLFADIGIMPINFALTCATVAFMTVYLVLRLSVKRSGRQLRTIKHYYKNFKTIARCLGGITAIYTLIISFSSVSPMGLIISLLGVVFIIIKLIVELAIGLIKRRLRKIGEGISDKLDSSSKSFDDDGEDDESESIARPRRRKLTRTERRKRRREKTREEITKEIIESIIIPVDTCLLSDIEE